MTTGRMHAATTLTPILKRVLEVLERGPATTMEIIQRADVCAVNSHISALRRLGYDIACEASYASGARAFKYRLVEGGQMGLRGVA